MGANWRGARQAVFGGWELSTVTVIESGPYQTPSVPAGLDQSNTDVGDRRVLSRPDCIGNGDLANPTADQYYNASAFTLVSNGAGRFGNCGAGILEGPGTVAIAAGMAKTFQVKEKLHVRLEATFTNLPNHPNFVPPSVVLGQANFGKLTTVQSAENSGNRTGQVGVRAVF